MAAQPTLHGGGAEELARRRIEAVLLAGVFDGAFLDELADAAQEAERRASFA